MYKEYYQLKTKVVYPFGKCDEIQKVSEECYDAIELKKHTKSGDRIGYFYHTKFDELIEPKYLNYKYYVIKCEQGVGLYTYKSAYASESTDAHMWSDTAKKSRLTTNVELAVYTKLKNKKKVVGIKQKVYDEKKMLLFMKNYCHQYIQK